MRKRGEMYVPRHPEILAFKFLHVVSIQPEKHPSRRKEVGRGSRIALIF